MQLRNNICTVIVVTFNSAHCISQLKFLNDISKVIFVDNASDDDTCNIVKKQIPNAKVIVNQDNKGFGAANNRALRLVDTPFALLLNPDCITTEQDIDELLRTAGDYPNAAVIAPHLFKKNGSVEVNYRWPHTLWKSFGPQAEGPCCVGFVCGAALLVNMHVAKQTGFFDEDFFLYYEDEDLCQRIFNQKKEIILTPNAIAHHFSRGSVKGKNPLKNEFLRGYHHARSKIIFEKKHVSEVAANILRKKTLLLACLLLVLRLIVPQPKYICRLIGRIVGLWRHPRVSQTSTKSKEG